MYNLQILNLDTF